MALFTVGTVRTRERAPRGPVPALVPVVLLALSLLAGTAPAATAAPSAGHAGPAAYTAELTADQLALVMASGVERREVLTAPGSAPGSMRVEIVLGRRAAATLIAQGVPLQARAAAARAAAATGVFRPWSGAGGLREEFVALAAAHPDLVEQVVIGRSVNGQEILAFKVTADAGLVPDGQRPAVLYASAQHAREWITPEMTRRLMRHVLDASGSDPEIRGVLDRTELWFVPVLNPDGYDHTFTTDRLWRKNLRDNDGDGAITGVDGVDLNRNFATRFGYDEEGSSSAPESETFRGPAPASEPETQALDGLMRRIGFEFLVNYHSAAELLLYGTGWQVATPTPDDVLYEAMAGDDANPAVAGYDPDISAELYTTNGETTEHAQQVYGTLAFTPEMSTCQTASGADPADPFEPDACASVFEFPDSEPLVQAEFAKNLPFALAVARSAQDPSHPVSVVGRTVPDFVLDPFTVSYGSPQTVAVTARRDLRTLDLRYRVSGGAEQRAPVQEWEGGERYGDEGDVYYAEFRGEVTGARTGDTVEVWFTGVRPDGGPVSSERFTYTVAREGGEVLVLANEDYEGYNPGTPGAVTAPRYAQQHVDALTAAGTSSAVWDVSAQGVPHDLGVLGHFDSVVWYLGDNRLTQDAEDVVTVVLGEELEDAAVAERQQFLTLAVRDYLNGGGTLALTGETAAYHGTLGTAIGGIYYGLDGAPEQDCVVTGDPFSDCLLLADDFAQYYLGAYTRSPRAAPQTVEATGVPITGTSTTVPGTPTNAVDEAGTFLPTSAVLPVARFPQFASAVSALYRGGSPSNLETFEGSWFAAAAHADGAYMRLSRTVDLTGVTAAQAPALEFALSHDVEAGYDNVIVEAHPVGTDAWTTLPEAGGRSDTTPPAECESGALLELHPFLGHYLTGGAPCTPTGTTGAWNRITGTSAGWQEVRFDLSAYAGGQVEVAISYVTDPFIGGAGVFVDRTRVTIGGTEVEPEAFETGLGPWATPGAPAGSPGNADDFQRAQSQVGAAITTDDTVLLGFGIEQVPAADRVTLLGGIVQHLTDATPPVAR
ncbi:MULTISPECIES: M14 family zinc carboxypeptidase [unclassified Geodermatophilus]|uniref:M14 family metallopeptidase n=1 Tax=unclassified Geodermatophilus TaxID=2637632 RepID=UPI003EEC4BA7